MGISPCRNDRFFCPTLTSYGVAHSMDLEGAARHFIRKVSFSGLFFLSGLICAFPCYAVDFVNNRTLEYGLQENPEILVNSQGLAQHDLSIRGSSYTGTGISINGLNLKVPYSAHFNSELPVLGYLLTSPDAVYGLDNISGHSSGTAEYTTMPQSSRIQAMAGMGTPEHSTLNALGTTRLGDSFSTGGFIDYENAHEIDYEANQLKRYAGGLNARQEWDEWSVDLLGGYQQKEFGAQGYYGVPASQYAQQQLNDSWIYLGAGKGDLDDAYIRAGTALRQMDDQYTTTGYSHDIRSRHAALMLEGRTMEIQHIALNLRGDVENEYADGRDRTRGSVLLLPEARFERVLFKAGFNTVIQTAESAEFLPAAGADWFATDNTILFAAYSENVQQPDYQTLENNPQLQQQVSANTEVGLRQFLSASMDWKAAAFHRRLENASDWIGGTTATDLGTLNVGGVDAALSYYPSENLRLQLFYQWAHKDNSRTDGFYELDYPEHMLNLSAYWRFLEEFSLSFAQTTRLQTENDARTSSDFGADASLGLHYFPRFAKNVRLSFRVDNLWGSNFQALPGLKPKPASVFTGITVAW